MHRFSMLHFSAQSLYLLWPAVHIHGVLLSSWVLRTSMYPSPGADTSCGIDFNPARQTKLTVSSAVSSAVRHMPSQPINGSIYRRRISQPVIRISFNLQGSRMNADKTFCPPWQACIKTVRYPRVFLSLKKRSSPQIYSPTSPLIRIACSSQPAVLSYQYRWYCIGRNTSSTYLFVHIQHYRDGCMQLHIHHGFFN